MEPIETVSGSATNGASLTGAPRSQALPPRAEPGAREFADGFHRSARENLALCSLNRTVPNHASSSLIRLIPYLPSVCCP